jgi:RES domain-containing protein
VPNPDLVERLDQLPRRMLKAVAYRHVSEGRQPLSGEGARIQGGRWNSPESFPTLYVGMTEDTVAAEFRRLATRSGRSTADFLPRQLYQIEVKLQLVLDLTDAGHVHALKIDATDLVSDDLTTCQALGDAAHYLGTEAVLAPSAAGAGLALAIFTDRLGPTSVLSPRLLRVWDEPAAVP